MNVNDPTRVCIAATVLGGERGVLRQVPFRGRPVLLSAVAAAMLALVPDCDVLAGMELGGIPIATVMSQLSGAPLVFVRKSAKEYGTCKRRAKNTPTSAPGNDLRCTTPAPRCPAVHLPLRCGAQCAAVTPQWHRTFGTAQPDPDVPRRVAECFLGLSGNHGEPGSLPIALGGPMSEGAGRARPSPR